MISNGVKEREILINGLKINYKIAGRGPAILVLHGWGGSSDSWIRVQGILASQGYKVICPDFPGFGKSTPPPEPWEITDYSSFVLNFVKELKLGSFFLLGHSFGGRIAIKFVVNHPKRVKSLILCDSAGIKPKSGPKTRVIYWIARIGNAIFTPKHFARFKDAARNLFYIFLRNRDYVKANGVMKETIKKVLSEDLLLDLAKIKTKTLITWGGIDKMVPPKYANIFKEKIKDSKLEILPKIGHSPHLEIPGKFSEIILNFLKEN
jgi:pimeloyl-ACP methyl ester carboxylesterase